MCSNSLYSMSQFPLSIGYTHMRSGDVVDPHEILGLEGVREKMR